eukprot:COSAG02_NODE_6158_length_3757_cov_2.795790_6_plen_119_part_00
MAPEADALGQAEVCDRTVRKRHVARVRDRHQQRRAPLVRGDARAVGDRRLLAVCLEHNHDGAGVVAEVLGDLLVRRGVQADLVHQHAGDGGCDGLTVDVAATRLRFKTESRGVRKLQM